MENIKKYISVHITVDNGHEKGQHRFPQLWNEVDYIISQYSKSTSRQRCCYDDIFSVKLTITSKYKEFIVDRLIYENDYFLLEALDEFLKEYDDFKEKNLKSPLQILSDRLYIKPQEFRLVSAFFRYCKQKANL